MADVFLIKAPWTNKDFSYLKRWEQQLSRTPLIYTSSVSTKIELESLGFLVFDPSKFRNLGDSGDENQRFLNVVVEWPNFLGEEYREFRHFLLSGGQPCLLLQSFELIGEETLWKSWGEGEFLKVLMSFECSFPSLESRTMQQNIKDLISYAPKVWQGTLKWLLLGQSQGDLLGWGSENKDRRDRNQTSTLSRKTCDCHFNVEKWSQCLRSFLWRARWREEAQGFDFRAWLYGKVGNFSLQNEDRAA